MDTRKSEHNRLIEDLWNQDERYYDLAEFSSKDITAIEGLRRIQSLCQASKNVLDCGCGEGQKLALMSPKHGNAFGVDISRLGLNRAKRFNNQTLIEADIEYLPFRINSFEATFCAYVIEHVRNPECIVNEMIRVTKKNGYLMIIAPNYGSPFYPSPPNQHRKRFRNRGVRRLIKTHLNLFYPTKSSLGWDFVQPLVIDNKKYEMDWDTTVEPYLYTLVQFLKAKGLKVVDYSSHFETIATPPITLSTLFKGNIVDLLFRLIKFFASLRISPYKYYGPVCYVIAKKD